MKKCLVWLAIMLAPAMALAQPSSVLPASPPAAAAGSDPASVVRSFYPVRAEAKELPLSSRLMKLLEAATNNSKRINAPVAGLDFAFQVNSQDTEDGYEKGLKIAVRRNDGKRARVRVSLHNFRNVELVFEMVFENGTWLVDDVRSIREPRWILSRLYLTGAREK